MKLEFEKILKTKEELITMDRSNPYMVSALLVHTICSYDKENPNNFYDMLQTLLGEYQPLSELSKQNIKDRMMQNDKYNYIGKSYFEGATNTNDYTPTIPYSITITDDPNYNEEGYKRVFLQSGGADSKRPIMLRLAKDGNYYVWSDSYMGLLSDIRPLESINQWA